MLLKIWLRSLCRPERAMSETSPTATGDSDASERTVVDAIRALHEPPIGNPASTPPDDAPIRAAVRRARLAQLSARPEGKRIALATWPEVAFFYASATPSNQQRATPSHARWYRYAFELTIRRYYDYRPECFSAVVGVDLDDYQRRQLGSFRRALKRLRDRWFLDHHYDALVTSVPKAAWKSGQRSGRPDDVPSARAADAPASPRGNVIVE